MAPDYIKESCIPAIVTECHSTLRSVVSNTGRLTLPTRSSNTKFDDRAFQTAGPTAGTAYPSALDNPQLRQLRSSMTREALRHRAYALVLSRVDYCNSLRANVHATSTKRLQSLINMAARVVSGRCRFDHNGFHKGQPALAAYPAASLF